MISSVKKNITVKIRNNTQSKYITDSDECINIIKILIPTHIDLNLIPKTVHTLEFNYLFKNIPCEIPPNIKKVFFYEFTYLLEELPNTINEIEIYKGFNHPVDKLHFGLKSINFGWNFNHEINNLPSSLEKIVLGANFNHQINNLPSNIKFIYLSNPKYDYETIKKLPKSILFLQLGINEDIDFELHSCLLTNLNKNYELQLEQNYAYGYGNGYAYSNTIYFKNFYFYKV